MLSFFFSHLWCISMATSCLNLTINSGTMGKLEVIFFDDPRKNSDKKPLYRRELNVRSTWLRERHLLRNRRWWWGGEIYFSRRPHLTPVASLHGPLLFQLSKSWIVEFRNIQDFEGVFSSLMLQSSGKRLHGDRELSWQLLSEWTSGKDFSLSEKPFRQELMKHFKHNVDNQWFSLNFYPALLLDIKRVYRMLKNMCHKFWREIV